MDDSSGGRSPAAARALAIPHIVDTILEYADIGTVRNCSHASKSFRDPSLEILWEGCSCPDPGQACYGLDSDAHNRTPSLCELSAIASQDPQFMRTVLSYVKHLRFWCDCLSDSNHAILWNSPNLWSNFRACHADIGHWMPENSAEDAETPTEDLYYYDAPISIVLQPQLRTLVLDELPIRFPNAFLDGLRERCPCLERLEMDVGSLGITDVAFRAFLDGMPSLSRFIIDDYTGKVLTIRTLIHLLARPNLQSLQIELDPDLRIDDEAVREAQRRHAAVGDHDDHSSVHCCNSTSATILDNVDGLDIHGPVSSLMLTGVANLRTISLSAVNLPAGSSPDIGIAILKPLGRCHLLEDMKIHILIDPPGMFVTSEDLIDFARQTRKMTRFGLSGRWDTSCRYKLPVDTLVPVLKSWPELRAFTMNAPHAQMASSVFYGIPRYCRFLKSLNVGCDIDVEHRDVDPDECFQHLSCLTVHDVLYQGSGGHSLSLPPEADVYERFCRQRILNHFDELGYESSGSEPTSEAPTRACVESCMDVFRQRLPMLQMLWSRGDFGNILGRAVGDEFARSQAQAAEQARQQQMHIDERMLEKIIGEDYWGN